MKSDFKNMLLAFGMCSASVFVTYALLQFAIRFPEVFILIVLAPVCVLEICFFLAVLKDVKDGFWKK